MIVDGYYYRINQAVQPTGTQFYGEIYFLLILLYEKVGPVSS